MAQPQYFKERVLHIYAAQSARTFYYYHPHAVLERFNSRSGFSWFLLKQTL